MGRVAIVTDNAADLRPEEIASAGVLMVPLSVSFGDESFQPGIDLTNEQFYERLTAPGAPFPKTAAPSAGLMQAAFERALGGGADAVVCITLSGGLSATLESARIARAALPDREIHIVDTRWASYPEGVFVQLAVELSAQGGTAREIAAELERRVPDMNAMIVVDTLEYLRRGGRISGTKAALATALSVKPILTVEHGVLEQVDRVRTRSKARARAIELLRERIGDREVERAAVLQTVTPDAGSFAGEVARVLGLDQARVPIRTVGPTIGAHLGPGMVAVLALARSA
jgi:DegV family protein with EDD domain